MDVLKLLLSALQLLMEGVEPFLPPFIGFILLDQEGRVLLSTKSSRCFCQILKGGECLSDRDTALNDLPRIIQDAVQYFLINLGQIGVQIFPCDLMSQHKGLIQMEITLINWSPENKFLWLNLIDAMALNEQLAQGEAYRYGLTKTEAEVWKLRRQDFSYRQIAQKLYITVHTVKKHIQSINLKMRTNQD